MPRINQSMTLALALLFVAAQFAYGQTPAGTEFTYQGQLTEDDQPANGFYDMSFSLWTAESGGSQLAFSLPANNVEVVNGVFSVELDFTPGAFNTDEHIRRWIEIEVDGTTLTPRQPLTGTPFAIETRGLHVREDGGGLSVGIGQPSSTGEFTVFEDTAGFGRMWVETRSGGDPAYAYKTGSNVSVMHYVDGSNGSWKLRNGGADRLHVATNGFVGVNKSSPVTGFDSFAVFSDTGNGQYGGMYVQTNSGGQPFYGYSTGSTVPAWTYFSDNTNSWRLNVSGTDRLSVLTNGNVGVGVNAPAFKFQVNGECAKPGGGSWSNSSDRRLKKNINDLEGSLEKLMQLRGVTFEYLDPKSINELEGERVGVIAQEVEKVFPDWVTKKSDGFKSVTFRGFEALTIEALRELRDEKDAQIQSLEKTNTDLLEENEELRNRMDELEVQIQSLVEQVLAQQTR